MLNKKGPAPLSTMEEVLESIRALDSPQMKESPSARCPQMLRPRSFLASTNGGLTMVDMNSSLFNTTTLLKNPSSLDGRCLPNNDDTKSRKMTDNNVDVGSRKPVDVRWRATENVATELHLPMSGLRRKLAPIVTRPQTTTKKWKDDDGLALKKVSQSL